MKRYTLNGPKFFEAGRIDFLKFITSTKWLIFKKEITANFRIFDAEFYGKFNDKRWKAAYREESCIVIVYPPILVEWPFSSYDLTNTEI